MCIEVITGNLTEACWGSLKKAVKGSTSVCFLLLLLLKNCDCLKRLLQEWLLKETFCLKWFFLTATKPSLIYTQFGLWLEHSLELQWGGQTNAEKPHALLNAAEHTKKPPSHARHDLKSQDRFTQYVNHPRWLVLPSCLSLSFHAPPSCRVISSVGWTLKPAEQTRRVAALVERGGGRGGRTR